MSTSPASPEAPIGRTDRVLAFMSLGIAIISIACFFAIMIAGAAGVTREGFSSGLWPIVTMLPMIGLPLAFLLIVALLILTWMRRGRAGRARA